ncbi:hypothetical protein AVEN_7026-1 [Araneus ventricosus]|uniref:Uncharacterized protein n=1 Tax=Araneus ventricosus TaxID=182803 RepID=A0A4Y2SQ16_ARAVE|nr:hypothetical protein AVEN_7026-1 [Araneus ventricosus]
MEAPCQSPFPSPHPDFKTGPHRPALAREPHFPSPTGLHFVVFAFVREPHTLSLKDAFRIYDPTLQTDKELRWKKKLSNALRQFSLDFSIDGGYGVVNSKLGGTVSPRISA